MCTRAELDIIMEEAIQQVSHLLGNKLNSVILFGSYARGDIIPKIQILILC